MLIHFAKCHKHLGKSSVTGTENREGNCEEEEAFDPDAGLRVCKGNCPDCMGCILTLLTGCRFQCRSYNKLYKCLTAALNLPYTVVSCERAFSKLRFVKSRLRSLIGQELLESLLLCSIEFDLLKAIDNDTVAYTVNFLYNLQSSGNYLCIPNCVGYCTNHLSRPLSFNRGRTISIR